MVAWSSVNMPLWSAAAHKPLKNHSKNIWSLLTFEQLDAKQCCAGKPFDLMVMPVPVVGTPNRKAKPIKARFGNFGKLAWAGKILNRSKWNNLITLPQRNPPKLINMHSLPVVGTSKYTALPVLWLCPATQTYQKIHSTEKSNNRITPV